MQTLRAKLLALPGLLSLLVGLALTQEPAGTGDAAAARREAGRRALAEGRRDEACAHFTQALERSGGDRETLALLLEANDDDPDARALWTLAWHAAAADAQGRSSPGHDDRGRLDPALPAAALVAARAAAVQELAAFAEGRAGDARKRPEEALVADWARRLAREIAGAVPALERAFDRRLPVELELDPRPHDAVVDALEALVRSTGGADPALAARAARCLHGLAVQAGFEDLRGARPRGMERVRARAAEALGRARAALTERAGPWTVAELEWLTAEEGEAFTRAHADFGDPGVALSPEELYRVETDCGFEILLGTALTVELHHRRLVNWYGRDPFEGRAGIVRVVPTAAGLEAEGAPFWWAGGFQGGDVTVVRHAMGNVEGLGRVITHELTHRFDGAIYPGLPAWLGEGKAVWTGAAYGHSSDEEFVADHASFGTFAAVGAQGWGSPARLATLIAGTVEDYRDNYSAGYALYVYLNTWMEPGLEPGSEPAGTPLFQDRLQRFQERAREGGRDPRAFFEELFCDGREGRPADLESFAAGFDEFLAAFRKEELPGWTGRYTQRVPPGPPSPTTFDEPTWPWTHARHEPPFGREQARLAGELLLEAGRERDAVRALLWALAVDGPEPRTWRPLRAALERTRRADAAWVAAWALAFPGPTDGPGGPGSAPFLRELGTTRSLLALLAQNSADMASADRPHTTAALAADHDRLARWLGAPPLGRRLDAPASPRHPFERTPRPLAPERWLEDELVGFSDGDGPWTVDEAGTLHLGRRAPRSSTGLDRTGGGAAFVRQASPVLPGSYVVRARIQATTARFAGAVVIGHRDRDRALRFGFRGDALRKEGEPSLERIDWSLAGTWERDGPLETARSGGVDFGRSVSGFDLELVVDGPSVRAFVNGRLVGTFGSTDGAPIAGYVGFATAHGALEVRGASLGRLDRARIAGLHAAGSLAEPGALDLGLARGPSFERLENLPVRGLPSASQGTLCLWIPMPWPAAGRALDVGELTRSARSAAERLAEVCARADLTQPVTVALPAVLGEERLAELRRELEPLFEPPPSFLTHALDGGAPPGASDAPDRNKRWLILVDPAGLARVVVPASLASASLEGRLGRWLRALRDHGQPPRELPEPERGAGEAEGGEDR